MLYAMLIYQDEAAAKASSQADLEESVGLFKAFQDKMDAAGHVRGGERLRHSDTATSVQSQGREDPGDRRPLRRNQRTAGRFLPDGMC